ncbi:MAG: DUF4358 domain-containing protein [Clostridiales bacterium]|nr:DUF4358 domain-containing protein [Clostridiales bacterium]
MRNKKLVAMSLVVALTFTACGKSSNKEENVTPTPVVESTEETVTETPEVEEEVVEEEITEEVTEEEGSALVSNETLDQILEKTVEELGDDFVANMPYDSALVSEMFGVNADWYDAAIAQGPMMSVHVDQFLAFHATEGNLENIKTALEAYCDAQINDACQYPMNLNKIQGCVVETVGDYVFLSILGFVDDTAYESEDQVIEEYKKINESVIEIAKEIIG